MLGILGYVGALLTGIYTFRMIFRAFFGDPCEEAVELEHGHLHHPESGFNPNNHELEDTDVGFPGPDHNIAERNWTMKFPMATLGVLALIGGAIEIPGVDDVLTKFLRPTFATLAPVRVGAEHRPGLARPDHRRADRGRRHLDRVRDLGP